MNILEHAHARFVFSRRVRVLAAHLAEILPARARVLDIGCGNGLIAKAVLAHRRDLQIVGTDVLVRDEVHIPVTPFDGRRLPFEAKSFDAAMLIDVVHHATDPVQLLAESARVAGGALVIKDHLADRFLARPTLRLMDVVGNARHGVALPYNYWCLAQWRKFTGELDLMPEVWKERLGLYPVPANFLFERSLHFLARYRTSTRSA